MAMPRGLVSVLAFLVLVGVAGLHVPLGGTPLPDVPGLPVDQTRALLPPGTDLAVRANLPPGVRALRPTTPRVLLLAAAIAACMLLLAPPTLVSRRVPETLALRPARRRALLQVYLN